VLIIKVMRRAANWLLAGSLILAMIASGCLTPPSSSSTATEVGSTIPEPPTSYTPPSITHPAPLKNAHVDQAQSTALTDYLKTHHLPLVGAQVLSAPDGERQVILFGFVATDYGKGDAESKTRRYINDPKVTVDNRVKIEPSLARPASSSSPDSQNAEASGMSGVQAYESQSYADQIQQQQQMYGYQNSGPSPMATMIPLLGMFGATFGGGSFGMSSGFIGPSFGGGYGGYPSAPPPSYAYPAYPNP
jgi:hypothetical protein